MGVRVPPSAFKTLPIGEIATKERKYIYPLFLSGYKCLFNCIYCNPEGTSGEHEKLSVETISYRLERWIKSIPSNSGEVAIYGCDYKALPKNFRLSLLTLLTNLKEKNLISKIRISIRPDTLIQTAILDQFPIDIIELGVPSMNEDVLQKIQRGHSVEIVAKAIQYARSKEVEVGCQTMTALPGANKKIDLDSAYKLVLLQPDFVRIHPTLVLQNTELESLFKKGMYHPISIQDALSDVADLVQIYRSNKINVIRIGFHIPEKLKHVCIAGPVHPSFGMLVESEICFRDLIYRLQKCSTTKKIYVSREKLSYYIGYQKINLIRLKKLGFDIQIVAKNLV